MAPGPDREQVCQSLCAAGFLRQEWLDSPEQVLSTFRTQRTVASTLLVVDAGLAGELSLENLRALQREHGEAHELPVALISREAPAESLEDPLICRLPWPAKEDPSWLPLLDDLAGLS